MTNAVVMGAKYALREMYEDMQYWQRRRRHMPSKTATPLCDKTVVKQLRAAGGYVSSLDELGIPETAEMLKAADDLFVEIANRTAGKGGFVASATAAEIGRLFAGASMNGFSILWKTTFACRSIIAVLL
jgi:hypothetical protein